MKILAGKYKGRVLQSPKIQEMRPTSARLKEVVFALFKERLEGCEVLDLFCGVGGVGLEALSRGAKSCVFVEKNAQVLKCLRKNLQSLQIDAKILSFDAIEALKFLVKKQKRFDLIYIDPPYQSKYAYSQESLEHCSGLLKEDARILVEESCKQKLQTPQNLELLECRTYGNTALYIYKPGFKGL